MPPIIFTIHGADRVIAKLTVLGRQMPYAVGRAMFRFAEMDIATVAKRDYVPVSAPGGGALRSSIHVLQPVIERHQVTVTVAAGGAAAPYARFVHENPRSGRTGGFSPSGRRYKRWSRVGQWKYLETPTMLAASDGSGFAREASVELEAVIRGLR